MNTKSFAVGFATMDIAISAIKYFPTAFCDLGREVKKDVTNVATTTTSFFAGMAHAAKVRSGSCKLVGNDDVK